ncbi:MAG: class I SAM-dependent methyltransferase [Pyrinomonadaceae bacterium]|nr:class I SAM-dependent methyltransferase [Pyrinomonadaceae bacterium]
MSNKFLPLNDRLYEYLQAVSLREPDILRRLREETSALPDARMQISPEQGQFMALLAQLMNAEKTLEVGVFTGYSALCVALALPANGRVVACDISEEWTQIAQRYWVAAGIAEKITLRLAPANETLDELLADGQAGTFDFAFIDADKSNYEGYYERALKLIRTGGLIAVDNVLWSGRVADATEQEPDTVSLRAFNRKLHQDDRVVLSLVPIADGLTLALKRELR